MKFDFDFDFYSDFGFCCGSGCGFDERGDDRNPYGDFSQGYVAEIRIDHHDGKDCDHDSNDEGETFCKIPVGHGHILFCNRDQETLICFSNYVSWVIEISSVILSLILILIEILMQNGTCEDCGVHLTQVHCHSRPSLKMQKLDV